MFLSRLVVKDVARGQEPPTAARVYKHWPRRETSCRHRRRRANAFERKMNEQEYMPVETARERMCVSPGELLMLLEAGALRYRKDRFNKNVTEVCAEDVTEAVEYLARYRREQQERLRQMFRSSESDKETEAREVYYFNFADSDLLMLLMAVGSYSDAERDLYFVSPDERGSLLSHAKAVDKLYGRLEGESRAGRPLSEIVEDIFEQRPDQQSRTAVFTYLMDKARRLKKERSKS